jgi:hypothetical protein
MEHIRRIGFAQDDRNRVEAEAIKAVTHSAGWYFESYKRDPRSFEGRYACADLFKEQFEAYRASLDTRARYNAPLHNAAAVLASEQLRRVVADDRDADRDTVIFLTGIPGAGKTTCVLENSFPRAARAIYEGQLSRPAEGIKKIQNVIDSGLKPVIVVLHTRPEIALRNTLTRFAMFGRGASVNVMSDIQGRLPAGLEAIHERFRYRVALEIVDKRDVRNSTLLSGWNHLSVLRSEGDADQIKLRLTHEIEALKSVISDTAYRQAVNAPFVERGRSSRMDSSVG